MRAGSGEGFPPSHPLKNIKLANPSLTPLGFSPQILLYIHHEFAYIEKLTGFFVFFASKIQFGRFCSPCVNSIAGKPAGGTLTHNYSKEQVCRKHRW
jgi:hypothetical protein